MKINEVKSESSQTANLQLVKQSNLTLLFNLVNKHDCVSRAELAKITKLSPTTVSSLIEELLSNNMIIETGAGSTSTSGRKPIMLEVNPNGGYVISIEMLEDGFNCSLYNLRCKEIEGLKISNIDYNQIDIEILNTIEKLIKNNNTSEDKLIGICIGVPGIFDINSNKVISSTVIPLIEDIDFYTSLKQKFKNIPITLGNESSFYAYAEKEFSNNKAVKNIVFIDINVGIGAGIIMDGKIFTGSFGNAGEIGHISIDLNGPKCKCGNRGCLEVMASIPAISQKIMFTMMSGRDTYIRNLVGNDLNKINIEVVKQAMDNKDELVLEVIDETAVRLACGINNIINLFNPENIVIGGEIIKLGEVFLDMLRSKLKDISLKPNINKVAVNYSSIKSGTVTLGGAKYILDNIFNQKGFFIS